MRLRIVFPILAALAIAAAVLGIIWWQLSLSTSRLQQRLQTNDTAVIPQQGGSFTMPAADTDTGDRVLLHLRQGDLFALQGEWADAQTEYSSAVQNGGGIPALRKLAQAQMQRRDTDGVKATIQQLQDAGTKDEDLLLLKVIANLRAGELVQAKDLLQSAADSPQKQYASALLALIQGNHDQAKTLLQQVVGGWEPTLRAYARTILDGYDEYAQFPQSPTIHLETLLARSLAQVQECELALPLLSDVVKKQDDYRDAWIVQGYCELTTERSQAALSSLQRAYNLDPEKPEIQYFLARAYAILKDNKNAETFFQYALKNGFQPEKEVRTRLAKAALDAGDSSIALDQYKALLPLPDATPDTLVRFVTLAMTIDQKDDAYAEAAKAVTRWPTDASVYEMLGWAAEETGKTDEAKTNLERAVQLDPTRESARERLKKLQ